MKFNFKDEVGQVLSNEKHRRIFRLKYGIELNLREDGSGSGGMGNNKRRLVDDNSGPKLIENALQFTLEEQGNVSSSDEDGVEEDENRSAPKRTTPPKRPADVKSQQVESRITSTGKKRIQPVLMNENADDDNNDEKDGKDRSQDGTNSNEPSQSGADGLDDVMGRLDERMKKGDDVTASGKKKKKKSDPVEDALKSAAKAAAAAEGVSVKSSKREKEDSPSRGSSTMRQQRQGMEQNGMRTSPMLSSISPLTAGNLAVGATMIPPSSNRVFSVNLDTSSVPSLSSGGLEEDTVDNNGDTVTVVADCTNTMQIIPVNDKGAGGASLPCATLSIGRTGQVCWKDQIFGTSCTCIAATSSFLGVGTSDGSIYLYGTSPTSGWASCKAFRSHPPLILGSAIVQLRLKEQKLSSDKLETDNTEM
eukprot:1445663-Ditylum_brightwellii.AAC.1